MQTQAETSPPAVSLPSPPLPIQCVLLEGISWETYERLLAEHAGRSGVHFTYDQGRLEIIVLCAGHESPKHVLMLLVEMLAEELGIDIAGRGSTTFKRQDLKRGFEPDSCFYIRNAERIRAKDEISLTVDPPPDLIIEIDITSPSLNKLPLLAAIGVPEVWRYDGARLSILTLTAGGYEEKAESAALPGVTAEVLTRFVETAQETKSTVWTRSVREWAREHLKERT